MLRVPSIALAALLLGVWTALPGQENPLPADSAPPRLAPALSSGYAPDQPEDPLQKAFQFLHENRPREAFDLFAAASRRDPGDNRAAFGQAAALMKLGRFEEARALADLILGRQPDHLDALTLRGVSHYNALRFAAAADDFRRAITLAPGEGFHHEALAWALLCLGSPGEAAQSALQAARLYAEQGGDSGFSLLLAYLGLRQAGYAREAAQTLNLAATRLNSSAWPFPILAFLAGAINADALIVEVGTLAQETEARAYIGIQKLWEGRAEQARPHLEWVARAGDSEVFEQALAQVLLDDLESTLDPP